MAKQQTKQQAKPASKPAKKAAVTNKVEMDPNNPIPFDYQGTAFSFVNQSKYIPFLAPKDNYGRMLLEARLLSTTHNACVSTKKDFCAGNGFWDINGGEFDQPILDWFKTMNLKNDPATEINRKAFDTFFTWGNAPIEVVRFTSVGKKRLYIYVHNFLEWRLGEPNEDDICDEAIQSKLFLRQNTLTPDQIKKSKKLPIYNPLRSERENWLKDDKGAFRTLIWYKNEVAGFPYYGLPSAVSGMIYQLLEYEGAHYNLDNFDNNMVLGGLLALKGNLSQTEANRIGKEILRTHTGKGKRGRTAVVASEDGIEKSDFHQFDTTKDGSFNESDDKWTQKIILANQWDAVLAGIISPSTLGKGAGFITKILEIKLNTVIRPVQSDLMEKVWAHIFKIADEWLGLGLDKYNIGIKNSLDISGLTDVDITPAVTINEVRVAKGMPEDPTPKGQEYMKSTGPQQQAKQGGDNVPN